MTDGKFIAALGNPPRSDMFTAEVKGKPIAGRM